MLKIRGEIGNFAFYCPECEAKFGTTVEVPFRFPLKTQMERKKRDQASDLFFKSHENCGNSGLLDKIEKEMNKIDMVLVSQLQKENPNAKLEEIREMYKKTLESLA